MCQFEKFGYYLSLKFVYCAELVRKNLDTKEIPSKLSLSLNPEELDNPPEELINELSISKSDKVLVRSLNSYRG